MFKCPYCNQRMAHPEPEHIPMSERRRKIFDYIAAGGPEGISKSKVLKEFFDPDQPEVCLRTTLYNINELIRPSRIHNKGGIVRLIRLD